MWVLKLNSKVLCQHNVYNDTLPLLLNGSGDGIAKPNNNNNKRRNCTPKCGIVVQIQYSIYCIYWCHCVLWRLIIPTLDAMFVFHLFYSWNFPSLSFCRWGPFCQPPPPFSLVWSLPSVPCISHSSPAFPYSIYVSNSSVFCGLCNVNHLFSKRLHSIPKRLHSKELCKQEIEQ